MHRTQRHVVQLAPPAYGFLRQIRDRLQKLEGRRISLSDAVGTALAGMLDEDTGAVRKALEEKNRRVFVNAVGSLLVEIRPDLAKKYRGMSFNETQDYAVLDFGDAEVDAIGFRMQDPVDLVRN